MERDVTLEPTNEAVLLGTGGVAGHRQEQQEPPGAAERLADILYGVAARQGMIDDGLMAQRVGTDPGTLSQQLEGFSRRAVENDEPMWSVLVVSVKTQRPPSRFYSMARKLRPEYKSVDDEDIWKRETQRCYESLRIARLWLSQGWSPGSSPVLLEETRQVAD